MSIFQRDIETVDYRSDEDSEEDEYTPKVDLLKQVSKATNKKKRAHGNSSTVVKKAKSDQVVQNKSSAIDLSSDDDRGDDDSGLGASKAVDDDEVKRRLDEIRRKSCTIQEDLEDPISLQDDEFAQQSKELERTVRLQRERLNAANDESSSLKLPPQKASSYTAPPLMQIRYETGRKTRSKQEGEESTLARLAAYNVTKKGDVKNSKARGAQTRQQHATGVISLVDSDDECNAASSSAKRRQPAPSAPSPPAAAATVSMIKLRTRLAHGAAAHDAHEWKWKLARSDRIGKVMGIPHSYIFQFPR